MRGEACSSFQEPPRKEVIGSSPESFAMKKMGSAGRYPSGQRGQTVNLLAYVFQGSNPCLPTKPSFARAGELVNGRAG